MELTPFYSGRAYYKLTADDGQTYIYTPQEFVNKGFVQGGTQFFDNDLLQSGKSLFDKAFSVTLPTNLSVNDIAKQLYQNPNQGYAWKEADFAPFNKDEFVLNLYDIAPGRFNAITGLGEKDGSFVYSTTPASDWQQTYINGLTGAGTPNFRSERTEIKRSGGLFGGGFIGSTLGDIGSAIADLGPIAPLALNLISPGAGSALAIGTALGSGNIENAVQGLALSQLGSAAGGEISKGLLSSGVDPSTANILTNAAVTAGGGLLTGASPEQALQNAVLAGAGTGIANAINQGNASYQPTTAPLGDNYTAGADYSLTGTGGTGLQATQGTGTQLFETGGTGGQGITVPTSSNVTSMGGGQGVTAVTPTGTLGETGVGTDSTGVIGADLGKINTGGDILGNVYQASQSPNISAATITSILNNLFGGGTGTGTNMATGNSNIDWGSVIGGLLSTSGGLFQNTLTNEARKTLADSILSATKTAQSGAQFRPVGTTTSFGTSNFTYDPTTGQLTSAGYSLSPQAQAIQDAIMASTRGSLGDVTKMQELGRGYLATSPEQAAADWMQKQQAVLQPGRDVALSNIRNKLFQTGRGGLSVAQGGNLGAANPEMQAYYNALAQQDALLAAQAQKEGRAATTFGAGLLSDAYNPITSGLTTSAALEKLAQQPLSLSTDLAKAASEGGARSGALGVAGAKTAGEIMFPANQYNPWASLLQSVGTSQPAQNTLGSLFGNTELGKQLGTWLGQIKASDVFSGAPTGLNLGNITLEDISKIYAGGNPFENVLQPGETWAGE